MPDTFTSIFNAVLLEYPMVGAALAQQWLKEVWVDAATFREWGFRRKGFTIVPPDRYTTGTVSVAHGGLVVEGVGTAWTADMVGRQFRSSVMGQVYDVMAVNSSTKLTIDRPYSEAALSGSGYGIQQCYYAMPVDFASFYTIMNKRGNYRLDLGKTQVHLDTIDPQRSYSGQAYAAVYRDVWGGSTGEVGSVVKVCGIGDAPVATSSYPYSANFDSMYVVEIDGEGAPGVATFKWWRVSLGASTAVVSGVVTSEDPVDLDYNVQVYFPAGTYYVGATFVFMAKPTGVSGQKMRFELHPWPFSSTYTYDVTYLATPPEFDNEHIGLPWPFNTRGDVLLDMVREKVARWPGTEGAKNPGMNLVSAAAYGRAKVEKLAKLEMMDEAANPVDLMYQGVSDAAGSVFTSAQFLQTHSPVL